MLKGNSKGIIGENIREAKKRGLSERDAILVSMKNTPKKKSKKDMGPCCGPSDESYPYGLRLDLNNDSLTKLGVKGLPAAGKTVKIVAECKVDNTSEREDRDGTKNRNVGLQITKMKLG